MSQSSTTQDNPPGLVRTCRECGHVLPLVDFPITYVRGTGYRRTVCKPCKRLADKPFVLAWKARHPNTQVEYVRRWQTRNPELRRLLQRATSAVSAAIRRGDLVRPAVCQECGSGGPIEAAHIDYAQLLDVRWLCRPCHRAFDFADPKTKNYRGAA